MDNELAGIPEDVQKLIKIISSEIETGRELARNAAEREILRMYWNVGKHIKTHILKNEDRAEYGQYLFPVLAENLDINISDLYRSVELFEYYPSILGTSPKLTWSHYTKLLTIDNPEIRTEYEQKIIDENLSVRDLRALIKEDSKFSRSQKSTPTKLSVLRGEPWVYRLAEVQGKTMVDLGFRFYMESPIDNLKPDSVIKSTKENKEYKFSNQDKGAVPHYTYRAYLCEVLDGDTIWANIDLGFNTWTNQKIRLKGINTREIESTSGMDAKQFIESRLSGCPFIAIKTYWRDKFTRYLADVFYSQQDSDFLNVVRNGQLLNQELLDERLAVRY